MGTIFVNVDAVHIFGINIEKYSEEAKNGLRDYLKTMMLAEIERVKKRMEEI